MRLRVADTFQDHRLVDKRRHDLRVAHQVDIPGGVDVRPLVWGVPGTARGNALERGVGVRSLLDHLGRRHEVLHPEQLKVLDAELHVQAAVHEAVLLGHGLGRGDRQLRLVQEVIRRRRR